jgi:hypothetical protein
MDHPIARSRNGSRHSAVAVPNVVSNHFAQLRGRHRINPTLCVLLPDERGLNETGEPFRKRTPVVPSYFFGKSAQQNWDSTTVDVLARYPTPAPLVLHFPDSYVQMTARVLGGIIPKHEE